MKTPLVKILPEDYEWCPRGQVRRNTDVPHLRHERGGWSGLCDSCGQWAPVTVYDPSGLPRGRYQPHVRPKGGARP